MSNEFEDRENQLGELTMPIAVERGELSRETRDRIPPRIPAVTPLGQPRPAGTPSDIITENRALDGGQGVIGSPNIPGSVTTVYDALPINARDFLHTGLDFVELQFDGTKKATATLEYTVPDGFTGVLRGFRFSPSIIAAFSADERRAGDEFNAVKASLFIDGSNVPDYTDMLLGQAASFTIPTFVIATSGQKFILSVTVSQSYLVKTVFGSATGKADFLLELSGNNLLTRDIPPAFEIATQNFTGISK